MSPVVKVPSSMTSPGVQAAIEDFRKRPRPLALRCAVQHYDWGALDFIPDLLGIENQSRKPFAELWIGAHSDLPSTVTFQGVEMSLQLLIQGAANEVLGPEVADRFHGQLPFLLKVLSSAQPLSIQAHPNAEQARAGYERENRQGIPEKEPTRNYRDEHHKPELISALTDFYGLRGFRPLEEIGAVLTEVPELQVLAGEYTATRESLIALYTRIMRMAQDEVNAILTPLIHRLHEENQQQAFARQQREYWVLRADRVFSSPERKDRGIFSVFLLNLVHLAPGDAMYLPAGELHAYLEGTGVEIMANSNNVLRGGLTAKHVDVDELLQILTFSTGQAEILGPSPQPGDAGQAFYVTPAEEFVLARIQVTAGGRHQSGADHGVHVGVVTEGQASVSTPDGDRLELVRGNAFLIPRGLAYRITTDTVAVIFRASVPSV